MANAISGVTNLSGSPTEARVTLVNVATNTVVSSQLSNATTGAWAFPNLPAGMYEVVITKPGYKQRCDGPWTLDGTDTHFSSVKSLLHFNGTDASTTFTDQTGKTWTAVGNAQIDTAQSQFGGASGLFDGAGDSINTPSSTDHDFGSGDFTVEFFIRRNTANLGHIVGKWALTNRGWVVYSKANGNIQFSYSTTGSNFIDPIDFGGLATGVWYHIAVVRTGSILSLYINGVLSSTSNIGTASFFASTRILEVGHQNSINYGPFDGWLDELRITKGVARYVNDFTPPTAAFPNS